MTKRLALSVVLAGLVGCASADGAGAANDDFVSGGDDRADGNRGASFELDFASKATISPRTTLEETGDWASLTLRPTNFSSYLYEVDVKVVWDRTRADFDTSHFYGLRGDRGEVALEVLEVQAASTAAIDPARAIVYGESSTGNGVANCEASTLNLYNVGEPFTVDDTHAAYSEAESHFRCSITRYAPSAADQALTSDIVLRFTRNDPALWHLGPIEARFYITPL